MSQAETPGRLPPTPRAVRSNLGCGLWAMRLFILPHIFIGFFLLSLFALAVLVAGFGTNSEAKVTNAHTLTTSKAGMLYYLDYQFQVGGREYTNSASVSSSTYAAATATGDLEGHPSSLRVRHFGVGGWRYHLVTQEKSAWGEAGERLLIALLWNAFLSVFVFLLWVEPFRSRWLVRNGLVTEGTVVSTRTRQAKGTTYYGTFKFRDVIGREFEREMRLPSESHYREAQPGRRVTVVYSEHNPRRAVAYEWSNYRVVEKPFT